MNRDIGLTYTTRQAMTQADSVVDITIAFAPYDEILPLVVGLFRACRGDSRLHEGEMRNPGDINEEHRRKRAEDWTPDRVDLDITLPGVIVSEPKDSPDITLIEHWGNAWLHDFIGPLRKGTEFVRIHSIFDTKTRLVHSYTHKKGETLLRHVEVNRGRRKTGWSWINKGEIQPYEQAERYKERATGKRLDRKMLFDYAIALGVDLQASLAHRKLARACHITEISSWNVRDTKPPTRVGEAAYQKALSLGIAEPQPFETAEERIEGVRAKEAIMQSSAALGAKMKKAKTPDEIWKLISAIPKPDPDDEWAQLCMFSNWHLAWSLAIDLDMDSFATRRIERATIAATEDHPLSVTKDEIMKRRLEKQRQKILEPFDKRHREILQMATEPGQLLEIIKNVIDAPIPEMDERFKFFALQDALGAACQLDPDAPATQMIAEAFDRFEENKSCGFKRSSAGIRKRMKKPGHQRKNAARKRTEKAPSNKPL